MQYGFAEMPWLYAILLHNPSEPPCGSPPPLTQGRLAPYIT